MAKIDFGNGQVVELSAETTSRLKKELLKPKPPEEFRYGDFSMKIKGANVKINTSYYSDAPGTHIYRSLSELQDLRNHLDTFITYLQEIKNGCENNI